LSHDRPGVISTSSYKISHRLGNPLTLNNIQYSAPPPSLYQLKWSNHLADR